jgi:hypothetical protein
MRKGLLILFVLSAVVAQQAFAQPSSKVRVSENIPDSAESRFGILLMSGASGLKLRGENIEDVSSNTEGRFGINLAIHMNSFFDLETGIQYESLSNIEKGRIINTETGEIVSTTTAKLKNEYIVLPVNLVMGPRFKVVRPFLRLGVDVAILQKSKSDISADNPNITLTDPSVKFKGTDAWAVGGLGVRFNLSQVVIFSIEGNYQRSLSDAMDAKSGNQYIDGMSGCVSFALEL